MSIFVSIVSYRDKELLPTVKSLYENAKNPEDIHFGIISQEMKRDHPDLSFVKNLSYVKMDFTKARGVGYARKLAMELYSDQDFYFQIDSHTRVVSHWDDRMKSMHQVCKNISGSDKVILSQFPAPYEIHTGGKIYYPENSKELWTRPSWSLVHNRDHGGWSALRQEIPDLSQPYPSHTILAGYIFSSGNFVTEIPYDERISFMGEELCLALRSYTRGWKIYAPNEMLIWHYYKRKSSPKLWNQMEDTKRPMKWLHMEMQSKKVQRSVLTGEEQGVYGILDYEKYLEYQKMVGIDFSDFYANVINKKVNSSLSIQEITF